MRAHHQEDAVKRVEPQQVVQLLLPRFDPKVQEQVRRPGARACQGCERLAGRGLWQSDL